MVANDVGDKNANYDIIKQLVAKLGDQTVDILKDWHDILNAIRSYPNFGPEATQATKLSNQFNDFNSEMIVYASTIESICLQFIAANKGIFKSKDTLDNKMKALNNIMVMVNGYKIGDDDPQSRIDSFKVELSTFRDSVTKTMNDQVNGLQKEINDLGLSCTQIEGELAKHKQEQLLAILSVWALIPIQKSIANDNRELRDRRNQINNTTNQLNSLKKSGNNVKTAFNDTIEIMQYFQGFKDVWEFTLIQFEFVQNAFEQWQLFLKYNPGDLGNDLFPDYMNQMIPYFTNISEVMKAYIDKMQK